MRWMKSLAAVAALLALCWATPALALDYTLYQELLAEYVTEEGVNYSGLKTRQAQLENFLAQMASVDPEQLRRPAQMAYYINAYNAWTLKLILDHYPGIKSIKEIGGLFSKPWSLEIVRIGDQILTLNNLEHDILRPKFKDPRVHFAVNCASKSCPSLRSQPYTGADLERQLNEQTVAFINDPQSTFLKGDELKVSKIFDWFDGDFGDVKQFVIRYAQEPFKSQLLGRGDDLGIEYLFYDWSLNDVKPGS